MHRVGAPPALMFRKSLEHVGHGDPVSDLFRDPVSDFTQLACSLALQEHPIAIAVFVMLFIHQRCRVVGRVQTVRADVGRVVVTTHRFFTSTRSQRKAGSNCETIVVA